VWAAIGYMAGHAIGGVVLIGIGVELLIRG
jgi:hypothetical protein